MRQNQFQHKLLSPVSAVTIARSVYPLLISYQVKLYYFCLTQVYWEAESCSFSTLQLWKENYSRDADFPGWFRRTPTVLISPTEFTVESASYHRTQWLENMHYLKPKKLICRKTGGGRLLSSTERINLRNKNSDKILHNTFRFRLSSSLLFTIF